MDFRFTEDQQDLIDAAKAFFEGEFTVEDLRAATKLGMSDIEKCRLTETELNNLSHFSHDDLARGFDDMGLSAIMLPEKLEGLEQPLVVMTGIAEAAGYVCLPGYLIHHAGVVLPFLAHIGEDETIKTILDDGSNVDIITPLLRYVTEPGLDTFFVTTPHGAHPVHVSDCDVKPVKSVDPIRRWEALSRISKKHGQNIFGEQNAFVDQHGAVLTAAQLIGLSQRMVDMSVEYAKDRHQFGKAIGSFQAIKHQLSNVYTQIEFTRPMIHLAAIQGGHAVHTAKIAAIDTAMLAAETAIQVHGGMGYTFEVDLHLFMKRAWALCGEWGDRNYHMKKLEDLILDGDTDIGAGTTFAA